MRTVDSGARVWLAALGHGADAVLSEGTVVIALDTDDVWARIRRGEIQPGSVARSRFTVVRYSGEGNALDTVGIFPGVEYSVTASADGKPRTGIAPLGRSIAMAVRNDRIFIGTQEEFVIHVYDPAGELASVIRGPEQNLRVTAKDLSEYKSSMLRVVGDNAVNRERVDRYLEQEAHPPERPAYGRVLLDDVDHVWISEPHYPLATPLEWTVVDLRTGNSARVVVPDRFHVYEVGADYVLGRFKDDLGVEYIHLYTLTRN